MKWLILMVIAIQPISAIASSNRGEEIVSIKCYRKISKSGEVHTQCIRRFICKTLRVKSESQPLNLDIIVPCDGFSLMPE